MYYYAIGNIIVKTTKEINSSGYMKLTEAEYNARLAEMSQEVIE